MAFKLPCFLRKKSPANQDLPGFWYEDLQELEIIAHGSFGAVFTTRRRVKDDMLETGALETVVVKKMLGGYDDKEFVKEARMLNEIQHQNVVSLKGFCPTPCTILLEYVYFDFSPFGQNKKLNSLQDFLGFVDENDDFECFNKFGLHSKIAKDIAKGLSHLHARDIVHRDLKSANVLVSNQHYCHLTNEKDRGEAFQKAPIVCKLTDFGESRSRQLQTALVVNSRTQRMNRGTPVFCAPEAYLHQPEAGPRFAIDDLKQVDVWAYGMILFHLINPNLRYPYQTDLEASQAPPLDGLRQLLQQKTKPTFSDKYNEFQATDWLLLENLYHACTQWDPSERFLRGNLSEYWMAIQICSCVRTSHCRSVRPLPYRPMIITWPSQSQCPVHECPQSSVRPTMMALMLAHFSVPCYAMIYKCSGKKVLTALPSSNFQS